VKITRPDTTSMILTAACVIGIVVLALFHVAIPDVLTFVAMGALGIGGGTALNTGSTATTATAADSAAQRIAESLTSLEQLIGGARRASSAPAAARPPAPASPIPTQAGPVAATPNGVPAR